MYDADLAYIHHAGFSGFSRAAAPWILSQLHAAGIDRGRIVELGCGSGALARALTSTGYEVIGIDVSERMLDIARRLAPRARFRSGSIHHVELPACDAVISLGEAIAYLQPGERRRPSLRVLFDRVSRVLRAGGLFMFDVLVREGAPNLTARMFATGADWVVLSDARERSAVLTRHITTFRSVKGCYRRAEERHAVALYRTADIERWLRRVGFSVTTRRGYGPARLLPRRLAFIARRAGR